MQPLRYLALFQRFQRIDRAIQKRIATLTPSTFVSLWVSERDYRKHLEKRVRRGDIQTKEQLFTKTLNTYCHPDTIYYLKARLPQIRDKLLFIRDGWVDIFLDSGSLITSFPLQKSPPALLGDKKNQNYIHISIPLVYHRPKKAIICQKRSSDATDDSP